MSVSIVNFMENLVSLFRFSNDSPWGVTLSASFVEIPVANKEGTGFLAQLFEFMIIQSIRPLQCFQIAPKNEIVTVIFGVMQIHPCCGEMPGAIRGLN